MNHDSLCELRQSVVTPFGLRAPSCKCGSRAYPLCEGCRDGLHTNRYHAIDYPDCSCDLCEVAS